MKTPKNTQKYYCEKCDFTSNKLSEYNRHILTKKHQMAEYNQIQPKKHQKTPEEYSCECGKVYSHRASLFNHKKKCTYIEPEVEKEETTEEQAQEMIDNADRDKIKEEKVKIENADGFETKIKYDENGNVEKIKTDD